MGLGLVLANICLAATIEELGSQLFFDTGLSSPPGQACASCHAPDVAFTDPRKDKPTSPGILPGRFGNRVAPTAKYAAYSPVFHFDAAQGLYLGGQFLDGRAADLETQAQGPFLNPLEMANPDKATVVEKVRNAAYASQFTEVFGADAFNDVDQAYYRIAQAIAAFERTATFAPFSSKYDAYLKGQVKLTLAEARGLEIFENPTKGNCAACHPSQPNKNGELPLFTDFSYDNLGTPRNPANPFYTLAPELNPDGYNFVDIGLGKTVNSVQEDGKFKVPTLRNIAVTAPYTHNGYFTSLRAVVDFYNTRDTKAKCPDPFTADTVATQFKCWPVPEVATNVNHAELGNLGLSSGDVDDLVAFLNTLTDGYVIPTVASASPANNNQAVAAFVQTVAAVQVQAAANQASVLMNYYSALSSMRFLKMQSVTSLMFSPMSTMAYPFSFGFNWTSTLFGYNAAYSPYAGLQNFGLGLWSLWLKR